MDLLSFTPNELAIARSKINGHNLLGVIGDPGHGYFPEAVAAAVWLKGKREGSTDKFEAYLARPLTDLMDDLGLHEDTDEADGEDEGEALDPPTPS
ncbi:hypothetical protein [Jannaschia sp. R86511]|uniref:hypothetical protein n=1 Tax=Jannaschia sp. R86511 TaxID=3093853 RepID=UPI0036D35DE6